MARNRAPKQPATTVRVTYSVAPKRHEQRACSAQASDGHPVEEDRGRPQYGLTSRSSLRQPDCSALDAEPEMAHCERRINRVAGRNC